MEEIKLDNLSTRAPLDIDKQKTKVKTEKILQELDELQNLLFAESKHSVLVVVQGMDASGKDGAIKNVFGHLNPQGIKVQSFKIPTALELSHDFLWRVHTHTPAKGMIQVFNRSHYEDVIVTRVHKLITDEIAYKRMKAINDFEELISEHNNTHVLKFYLHVSREEQVKRLEERISDQTKQWKYNAADIAESTSFKEYRKVYEDCFSHCNKIPWIIVPSDQNWYKEFMVAEALHKKLSSLNMQYPGLKK